MEVMLRIELPDVPGSLSKVANVIATVHGDIQAVEVKSSTDGIAIDDLWVKLDSPESLAEAFDLVEGIRILYMGPSRGLPTVSTMRVSTIIQNVLMGTMGFTDGVTALVGGNLQASQVSLQAPVEGDIQKDRRVLRLPIDDQELVIQREYRFLDEEVRKAIELINLCKLAATKAQAAQHQEQP